MLVYNHAPPVEENLDKVVLNEEKVTNIVITELLRIFVGPILPCILEKFRIGKFL